MEKKNDPFFARALSSSLSISWTSSLELVTIHKWFTTVWTWNLSKMSPADPFGVASSEWIRAVFIPSREMSWVPLGHSVFILSAWHLDHPVLSLGRDTPGANQREMGWTHGENLIDVGQFHTQVLICLKIIDNQKLSTRLYCANMCKLLGEPLHLHILHTSQITSGFQLRLCRRQRGCTTHDLALRTLRLPGLLPFAGNVWDGNSCTVKCSALHSALYLL